MRYVKLKKPRQGKEREEKSPARQRGEQAGVTSDYLASPQLGPISISHFDGTSKGTAVSMT